MSRRPREAADTAAPSDGEPRAPEGDKPTPRESPGTVGKLVLGGVAGLIGTVVMTAYRMPISGSLPPTAEFWATYVAGGRPEDYPLVGLLLHLGYGTAGGVAFAATFPDDLRGPDVVMEREGALRGTVFGLLLSTFGVRVVLKRLLGMDLEPDERWIFHVSHVVYGLTVGSWFGSRMGADRPGIRRALRWGLP